MRSFGAGSSEKIWRLIVNGTIRKVANDNCAAQWAVIINILLRPARGRADNHNKDLTIQIQIMSAVGGSIRSTRTPSLLYMPGLEYFLSFVVIPS